MFRASASLFSNAILLKRITSLCFRSFVVVQFSRIFRRSWRLVYSTTSGNQFDTDASGTGKQIEGGDAVFEIDVVIAKDIEQVFLGKVCGRTCLECMGDVESASLVNTANYSHIIKVCRSNGRWLEVGRSMTCRKNLLSSVNSSSWASIFPVK